MAAKAGKPSKEVVDLLLAAHATLPDCARIQDALLERGEPVPMRTMQAGRTFPVDYRLPVIDPRVGLPGPDCQSLTLSQELARLKLNQVALVILLGDYRSNGFYSRSMQSLGALYPLISDRLTMVHVITEALTLSDGERAFAEQWIGGEAYALTRGVPLVVMTDGERAIGNALHVTHSPTNYLLGRDGKILVEGWLEDDGPIWQAFAIQAAYSRSA
jgi:hypothetical protein